MTAREAGRTWADRRWERLILQRKRTWRPLARQAYNLAIGCMRVVTPDIVSTVQTAATERWRELQAGK